MEKILIDLICQRLDKERDSLSEQFIQSSNAVGTRHLIIDNLLPDDIAVTVYNAFSEGDSSWRSLNSFREKKLTTKSFDDFPVILKQITFALQSKNVINRIEKITGIKNQEPDPYLYAGGLSKMVQGNYLHPHIDNSHDKDRNLYRTLNLLYYVTPEWVLENGGNLELWDQSVQEKVTIVSKFNRLVIMETNRYSWHSVSKILVDTPRCCVSNYYFSNTSPHKEDYFHITEFLARPDNYLVRPIFKLDALLRTGVRLLFHKGLGKKDIYKKDMDS